MTGILKNTTAGWFVWYNVMRDEITSGYDSLPLHPNDVKQINADALVFDNIEARIAAYPDVKFEIVKEYIDSHTNQVQSYAKLKTNKILD